MRCKKHATDLTSINGVCASCLRDQLQKLIVAQEEAAAAAQSQSVSENPNKSIPPPTSVSPHITRRKSDVTSASHVPRPSYDKTPRQSDNQRFYKSPQIAVISTTGGCIGGRATSRHNNKKLVKFATFQNLFRSNNNSNTNTSIPTPSSSASSSATTRIKNHHHRQRCVRNRGMSPVRLSDDDENDDDDDVSSEYESIDTDTSNSCKQTPMKTIRRSGNKSVSEMIFCLSPLVRANPNRLWKGKPAVDGTSSDVRIPVVPKLAYTKSFCANRSRKLADFGRSDPNR